MDSVDHIAALDKLFGAILRLHSFSYKSLPEAKKTIYMSDLVYCFDALSLCTYRHNLDDNDFLQLSKRLDSYYANHFDKEAEKERRERTALFRFLQADFSSNIHSYRIEKEIQPDFILRGEKTIGIEVVELTT